jgi:hypothetical protein
MGWVEGKVLGRERWEEKRNLLRTLLLYIKNPRHDKEVPQAGDWARVPRLESLRPGMSVSPSLSD